MEKKEIIISSDVGFNGFKTVVGERTNGKVVELFKTHHNSDIARYKGESIKNSVEDALYVIYTTENERFKYIVGNAAKEKYAEQAEPDEIVRDFYTNSEDDYSDYKRFNTKGMAMAHLAVLNDALEKLAGISERYSDIFTNPENYKLVIVVELPEQISKEESYHATIRNYITNSSTNSRIKVSIEGFSEAKEVPAILGQAKVAFASQVYAAAVCEISALDIPEEEVVSDLLPMFVFDCGGKTDGIAFITKTFDLAERRESNRDYSITKICMNVADVIYRKYKYVIEPQLVESKGTADGDDRLIMGPNEDGEYVEIDVKKIYEEELDKAIKGLYDYVFKNYKTELFQAKSYLFAGGAGVLYHKALTEYIKANFVNSSVKRKYILAEGKYGKETNGAIFAVAVGGLTLAESAFED